LKRFAAFIVLSLVSCKREPSSSTNPGEASSALPAASAPAAPPIAPKPWYEGNWSGTYESSIESLAHEVGGVRAWKQDEGKAASGPGTLKVSVGSDGVVTGEAQGALGAQSVSGHADEKGLWLTLTPKEDDVLAFRGTLVAERSGETVSGSLRASSGDSLTVRKATAVLRPASAP